MKRDERPVLDDHGWDAADRDLLADRDYWNRPLPPSAFGGPRVGSITLGLIAVNVIVYLVDKLLLRMQLGYFMQTDEIRLVMSPVAFWGHFSQIYAVEALQLWRFLTFQFLHANANHLIFNMLALYFFGPLVEAYLRPRQFIVFYLLCGVAGPLAYMMLSIVGWPVGSEWMPMVGASAGIFGVLVAAAIIHPHAMVYVLAIFPMRLITLAYLFIAIALVTVILRANNAGGEAAHLGGAAAGWLLMQRPWLLERIGWFGKRAPPF